MSPHPSDNSPWIPLATPTPSRPSNGSNRVTPPGPSPFPTPSLSRRQSQTLNNSAIDDAMRNCELFTANDVVTCYPPGGAIFLQHRYATCVWNSRLPEFTQTNLVSIFLVDAVTQRAFLSVLNYTNPTGSAGQISFLVNDTWFGETGLQWQPTDGNVTYEYYFVITDAKVGLDGSQTANPVFYAVQTTYADSVATSMSLSSLSVQSSLSSASRASSLASASATPSIQQPGSGSSFPHWAIAVIVMLGFLAIVFGGVLVWLVMRRLRRRERLAHRGSMGSSSPMMTNVQTSNSPQLPLLAGAVAGVTGRTSSEHHRPSSIVSPDGVSDISRSHSAGDQGPFSGADAAIMADAFRKALRKPEFADPPVEESEERREDPLINRELAEEGRDIRSVSSSRGVRVETLSDAGDTVQHH